MRTPKTPSVGALVSLAVAAWLTAGFAVAADAPNRAADEAFETQVRPILADRCWKCHGDKKQSSGLRLDSRAAMLEGGGLGPSIVPGDPANSPLIQAIRHEGDVHMPPKVKLPDPQIEALTAWVKQGAPWPDHLAVTTDAKEQAAETHWAFQPIRPPEPPTVKDPARAQSPIDAFLIAKLDAKGLSLSPKADRRTLIRRATFDLTGLPPTEAEVNAFLKDESPDAFAKLVERLLASPRYGERWGRHWLDVARYADTKGYVFNEERKYPFSYTYRDYVISAFNNDLPYDQFIIQQLAADQLPASDDPSKLAAMGFLTVGRRFLNNGDDIIDDRIDVTTRGLLGLTVSCARCHDHKFDPIPTADYYSLYGVFASATEPAELPVIEAARPGKDAEDYQAQLQTRRKDIDDFIAAKHTEFESELRGKFKEYLVTAFDLEFQARHAKFDETVRETKLRPELLRRVMQRWTNLLNATRGKNDPVLSPWHAFAALPAAEFETKSADLAKTLATTEPSPSGFAALLVKTITDAPPKAMREVVERYGDLLTQAAAFKAEDSADSPLVEGRRWIDQPQGPIVIPADETTRLFNRADRTTWKDKQNRLAQLDVTHPGAPGRAMVLNDKPQLYNPQIFVRGNPGRRGEAVPRRFLKVLSGPDRAPFEHGGGRLDLARAIASETNPLTARVMVNRIWMHHFGDPLVATPSDFGLRSEQPTHADLLDWLAAQFIKEKWSIKQMHRLMMNSAAYQQRSDDRPDCLAADPENLLVWKQTRRRLEFESMRDSFLAVAGKLDPEMGGRPVSLTSAPFTTRRTIYSFIDRQELPNVFRAFDFASPDASSPGRHVTVVPQQALFLMNSPFVVEQARSLAALATDGNIQTRVDRLYQHLFGRPAEPREVEAASRFLEMRTGETTDDRPVGWRYGYGRLEESASQVENFQPFPHWTGRAWQFSDKIPDPVGSFMHWQDTGGHVGPDLSHAVILRWTAPHDAQIAIEGTLGHNQAKGDGVRGRIVASNGGVLGVWTAHNAQTPTPLERYAAQAGETIDFVVDCRADQSFDSFTWSPVVRLIEPASSAGSTNRWDAKADFHGPMPAPLTPWESYAQVLMLTNEFVYVD